MRSEEDFTPTVPNVIRDFVFDLHDAVRRSQRLEDVQRLYETKQKEITDSYFGNSTWPEARVIANEASNDELFLALYTEMTIRHITVKLKPQLADHLASWANYKKLFELLATVTDADLSLSTQWIYDITQEFAYQFQGFCQYRCQVASLNAESIKTLQANRDAWNLPEVVGMLTQLINSAKSKATPQTITQSSVVQQLGYFASIELARLECLVGDYQASLQAIQHVKLHDKHELFCTLPICHFNVFYHAAISQMMLQKYPEALEIFQEIILYVLRLLKPGASNTVRNGVPQQLPRMVDKAMSLTAILMTIYPFYRIDDVVKEAIESKFNEKMKRLAAGDRTSAMELFDSACPKFISPMIPDYTVNVNVHNEVLHQQSKLFVDEVMQYIPFLKLRSFLTLYASIDISKLARFMEMTDIELINVLLSYKKKYQLGLSKATTTTTVGGGNSNNLHRDLNFTMDGGVLIVESSNKVDTSAYDRYFLSGVKKHREVIQQLQRVKY